MLRPIGRLLGLNAVQQKQSCEEIAIYERIDKEWEGLRKTENGEWLQTCMSTDRGEPALACLSLGFASASGEQSVWRTMPFSANYRSVPLDCNL